MGKVLVRQPPAALFAEKYLAFLHSFPLPHCARSWRDVKARRLPVRVEQPTLGAPLDEVTQAK